MQHDSMLSLRLSKDKRRRYTDAAKQFGVNRSRLIELATDDFLSRNLPQVGGLAESEAKNEPS